MSTEKVGVFNRLWLNTATTNWQTLEFKQGSSLELQQRIEPAGGMTGSRQMPQARVRELSRAVQGNLMLTPTPLELDALLAWALSVSKDGSNDYILPESHASAKSLRVDRDGIYKTYSGCVVSNITFQCAEGSFLDVSASVVGVDEATATNDPNVDGGGTIIAVTGSPYTINDCVLTVAGTTYEFRQFSLSIDHRLEVRNNNSITPSNIRSTGMMVGVQVSMPLGDAHAIYGSGATGAAIVATFTNGSDIFRATLPAVVFPKPPLELGTSQMMNYQLRGTAYRATAGTPCLTIRHTDA